MDTIQPQRVPPHSLEAEQSVLGCMLLDQQAVTAAAEALKPEDFYSEAHKEIYDAMFALYDAGTPVDIVTLSDELYRRSTMEGVGGIAYVTDLSRLVPSSASLRYYVEIVQEKSTLRKLISASGALLNDSFTGSRSSHEILEDAEKAVFDIALQHTDRALLQLKPTLMESIRKIEQLYITKKPVTGLSTGFHDLDARTTGLHPSELVLIAARPSMGKSCLGMNIAQHAAMVSQQPAAVFSLEMSREQLIDRILATEARVDLTHLRTGNLSDDDWMNLMEVMSPLAQAPLYIDDTPGITVSEMRTKCRRLKIDRGLGLVVIDYLQLMSGSRTRGENRQQEISEISRSLKILARELEVPIIALSQLSRAPEARSDHRPMLSDLRESGAIEQDADMVMFIYRDAYYNAESDKGNIAEIIISKQRNGSTGTINLLWEGQYQCFSNLTHAWQKPPGS